MTVPVSIQGISASLPLKGPTIVAIYGAGGKTSLLEVLGRELSLQGRRVILTTTTRIFRPETYPCVIGEDFLRVTEALAGHFPTHSPVVLGAKLSDDNKLIGIDSAWPQALLDQDICDDVIVEADGAARKPIKGYASYEPVLPPSSTVLIPVLGYDALGIPVDAEHVHRPEAFCALTGARPGDRITVDHFLTAMTSMIRLGQEKCPRAVIVPIVNKVDLAEDTQQITEIVHKFPLVEAVDRLLFTHLKGDPSVPFRFGRSQGVFEPGISVVMLAAGESVRMGRPKLALPLQGKTLLELAMAPVLASGIRDIIVVTSEDPVWIRERTLPNIQIVLNPRSREGIATSLQAGITAVSSCSQAILFSLGDQPFVTSEVYRMLIEHYRRHMKALTYPVFGGKRGNPVLFDRRLWSALMALEGDEGGKQIFTSVPDQEKAGVTVPHPGILLDIDTPEEYARMSGMDVTQIP
jgi:molybdenum cofactor cytidylyltransferase